MHIQSLLPALVLFLTTPSLATPIRNQYIVVYNKDATKATMSSHESWLQSAATGTNPQGEILEKRARPSMPKYDAFRFLTKYQGKGLKEFKGYTARMTRAMAEALKTLPEVAMVEQDSIVSISATQVLPPSWGLKRVSYADLPLPSNYTYPDHSGGRDSALLYDIVDTGIDVTHKDFEGRAVWDINTSGDGSDFDGHVAGTVGSITYGIAKKVTLHAVKVLDNFGSGTTSSVIAGIDYVAQQAKGNVSAIANMSLGGDASDALDAALVSAINAGVAFSVAAANDFKDACLASPSRVKEALCVAASTIGDVYADFSNYGPCVDVIGPGVNIASTWPQNSTNTISGTSMAAPHAAGVMALLLATKTYTTVPELYNATLAIAVKNRIKSIPSGTANLLLQIPGAGGANNPTPPAPSPVPTPPAGCSHTVCIRGGPLSCNDPCVQAIIKADPYCGTNAWDDYCIAAVKKYCTIKC
ncbi:hypothetical protein HDU97_008052 [Phlyctochytrium planicorne]|nr:hypothetical protein HDU97_008052 [Phlyctochytrium planicorne]